ncbi:MAG TPA: sulfotransferase [Caulobacteraceae bacterium]|jgi:Tfp pilus assembly protein PilF|nr:sulfotransferase [Caulobacteraceae bacterium]
MSQADGSVSLPASRAAALDRAAALLASDPARAGREAASLLQAAPADPNALLIRASAHRRLGEHQAALAVLEPLARMYPRAALTQYEYGVTLAAQSRPDEAVAALRRAVAVNCSLAEAWRALGDLLFAEGDGAGAERAFAEHARAQVRDPRLKPAAEALFAGRISEAEQSLRQHLRADPNDAPALQMLAEIYTRQGRLPDAEVLFARCLELEPANDGARFSCAEALFHQQKVVAAIPLVEQLLAKAPREPAYRNLLAACLGMVGEDERAGEIYEGLLADFPKAPKIWLNHGHGLRARGRQEEAVAAYRRAIALAPGLGDAYWSLANLKVAALGAQDEAAMRAQAARPDLSAEDRLHLLYALGKAAEDRSDAATAFARYAGGAKLRRTEAPYDPDELTTLVRRSKALFSEAFFAERDGAGFASAAPIFIVGLPRAGSTLVEQILASHSAVEGTMELPYVGLTARSLEGPAPGGRYPDALSGLDRAALASLGEAFTEVAGAHRKLGLPFFIDKMPNNFQHIGLIQLILPNARIIDVRRHPLGSCFSAFKQHFAQGQAFSYDLSDLGRYYRDYVELMAHFNRVLPGRVCRVIYEDLVEDTEAQVRRLLDYCGLPFEEACLRFHENRRTVRTVSSEQVRRPIYRDGVEQWRHYEPWLGPLKAALGPALEHWRD